MMTIGKSGAQEARERSRSGSGSKGRRSGSFQDAVKKGKEMLGLKGKADKEKATNGSAIADD